MMLTGNMQAFNGYASWPTAEKCVNSTSVTQLLFNHRVEQQALSVQEISYSQYVGVFVTALLDTSQCLLCCKVVTVFNYRHLLNFQPPNYTFLEEKYP